VLPIRLVLGFARLSVLALLVMIVLVQVYVTLTALWTGGALWRCSGAPARISASALPRVGP